MEESRVIAEIRMLPRKWRDCGSLPRTVLFGTPHEMMEQVRALCADELDDLILALESDETGRKNMDLPEGTHFCQATRKVETFSAKGCGCQDAPPDEKPTKLAFSRPESYVGFVKELEHLLNHRSMENGSNTPDFILAQFLLACLTSFDSAVNIRAQWYGRFDFPGQGATLGSGPGIGPLSQEEGSKEKI